MPGAIDILNCSLNKLNLFLHGLSELVVCYILVLVFCLHLLYVYQLIIIYCFFFRFLCLNLVTEENLILFDNKLIIVLN